MVVLDVAIVNVALPSIQLDLGFSQENLQWVISAYALVFGGFLLLGGRLADILGRRARLHAPVSSSSRSDRSSAGSPGATTSLIGARALQGLGAAAITPSALSILTTTFSEGRERNIALGAWGAVGGFGAAAGVLFGGILTDLLSWEWIFFVNVPIGLAGLALVPVLLAESRDAHGQSHDFPGAALVTSGLVLLVLGITQGRQWEWPSAQTIGVFTAAAVLLGRLRPLGAAPARSARPVLDLQGADVDRGERGRTDHGHGTVLDVPDAHALHAAGARVLAR